MSGIRHEIHEFDDSGMSTTLEQVISVLQQEVFTLKAQVADRIGLADAVRAINNFSTAQISERHFESH